MIRIVVVTRGEGREEQCAGEGFEGVTLFVAKDRGDWVRIE